MGEETGYILHLSSTQPPASAAARDPGWQTSLQGPGAPDPLQAQALWEEGLGQPFAGAGPAVEASGP